MQSESAQRVYERLGWSVIPVDPSTKHPLIPWRDYVERRADSFEIHEWVKRFPKAGIAVICGQVSGLLVLDADGPLGTKEAIAKGLPDTPMAETPSGGRHIYFKSSMSFMNGAKMGASKKIDVRSDAGYVIAPPSTRLDGRRYRWLKHPDQTKLADPPEWFLQMLKSSKAANQILKENNRIGPANTTFWADKLPTFAKKLVIEGHDLDRYPSRSECDLEVIQRLLCIGAPLDVVEEIFNNYAIGEKYHESGQGSRYIERTFTTALQNIRICKVKYADIREYERGKRLHVALDSDTGLVRTGLTVPEFGQTEIAIRWQALFDACGIRVPGLGKEELELGCRQLIGKKIRILFSNTRENPVVGFYHL